MTWAAQRSGLYYTAISTRLGAARSAHRRDCGAQVLITDGRRDRAVAGARPPRELRLRLTRGAPHSGWANVDAVTGDLPATPDRGRGRGRRHALQLGHHRGPKGVKPPLPSLAFPRRTRSRARRRPHGRRARHRLPLAGAAVPRRSAALHDGRAPPRRDRRAHASTSTPSASSRWSSEHRVTFTQVVPTMFVRLLKLPPSRRSRSRPVVAATSCSTPPRRARSRSRSEVIDWLGPIVHEYYGGTEGNGFVYCDSEEWLAHRGHRRPLARSARSTSSTTPATRCRSGETGTVYFEPASLRVPRRPGQDGASRATAGQGLVDARRHRPPRRRRLPLPHRPHAPT